jgi:hypothetical protein
MPASAKKRSTAKFASAAELARLRRRAAAFERFEEAYDLIRACAAHLKQLDPADRVAAKELRTIGLSVLRRLAKDMRSTGDGAAIFQEVKKAVGTVIPLFSKTLFQKAPRARVEKPALERPVPRAKVDGTLTQPALVQIARRVKSDEIETPEALRWYAKFVKAAPTPVIRRDAWRRGKALVQDAQRQARNNNFLSAYYAKKIAKFEGLFLGAMPEA